MKKPTGNETAVDEEAAEDSHGHGHQRKTKSKNADGGVAVVAVVARAAGHTEAQFGALA